MARLAVIAILFGSQVVEAAPGTPGEEFIFTSAPFPSCHASSLVELRSHGHGGEFLAVWFGGAHEGASDVAIWGSRRIQEHWSTPVALAREPGVPTWNPVLFYTHDGRLWLYYRFGPSVRTWTGARMFSLDDGRNWSRPEHLPAGLLGPIKDKPLVLPDGTVVSGSSVESYGSWAAWIERSTDNGRSFTTFGPITVPPVPEASATSGADEAVYGIIQPTIVALGRKKLRLYARSTLGRICVADSADEGRTWTQARPIDLPNPNSGIDAVGLRDGRIVVVLNNTTIGRTPLNLAVSRDGEHFHVFATLENAPGEYSYPAIIQGGDGDLYATWTWQRTRIRFAHISLSDVPAG